MSSYLENLPDDLVLAIVEVGGFNVEDGLALRWVSRGHSTAASDLELTSHMLRQRSPVDDFFECQALCLSGCTLRGLLEDVDPYRFPHSVLSKASLQTS